MASNIPITAGSGTASVATEQVGNNQFQLIEVYGKGGASVLGINPDGSINASIIGVPTVSFSGSPSISGAVTIVGTPSISGTVNIGTQSGSVVAFQGGTQVTSLVSTIPSSVIVGASIFGALPAGNAILGAVAASISGTVATTLSGTPSISGTVNIGITPGSVVAFQGGTQVTSLVSTVPSSVIVGASIFGQLPAGTAVLGSVVTLQGTNPWIITGSVQATAAANQSVSGTVTANQGTSPWIITGSVQGSFAPSGNQSVSGTVGASIIGQLPAGTAVLGSVATLQGTNPWIITGSVQGSFSPSGNQSVSGTVGASVLGNVNVTITSIATAGQVIGSVAALQGTNPWVVNFANSSIIAVNAGSVVALSQGSVITVLQSPSIVGTYAEDTGHTSGDKGVFGLNVRNDTMSSITSADLDYSPMAVGPAGELIAENAPLTKWVSGVASSLGGTAATGSLIPIIAAQGASIFTYITGMQIANPSANNVWVTLLGGTNSVIGFTMAPANGGSNIYYQNGIKTNANAAFSASVSAVGSVYLSAQGFISKT